MRQLNKTITNFKTVTCLSRFNKNEELDSTSTAKISDSHETNIEGNAKFFGCPLCRFLVIGVRVAFGNQWIRNTARSVVKALCRLIFVDRSLIMTCDRTIIEHFDELVNLVVNLADDKRVCLWLRLCSNENISEEHISVLNASSADPKNVQIGECALCKLVMKGVGKLVHNSYSRDKIKKALSKVCQKIHSHKCQSFVNKHGNKIIDLLVKASTRGRVCKLLLVCSMGPSREFDAPQNQDLGTYLSAIQVGKKKTDCAVCKAVVSATKLMIKSDTSRGKIREALGKVCGRIKKFGSKCQSFVNNYTNRLIDLIMNSATRNKVCRMLNLCSTPTTSDFLPEIYTGKVKLVECNICMVLLNFVRTFVRSDYVAQLIHKKLITTCSKMPETLKLVCFDQLNQHWGQLLRGLRNFNLAILCRSIRYCSTQDIDDLNENKCDKCKNATNLLKKLFKIPSLVQKFHNDLYGLCGRLSSDLILFCRKSINEHWNQWVEDIQTKSVEEICHNIKMCP